jgi:hypothetical protein
LLYQSLKWAGEVNRALEHGLETTIRELQAHRRDIESLPATGIPGELRRDLAEGLEQLAERLGKDDFYRHAADLSSLLTDIKARVRDAVPQLAEQQKLRLQEGAKDLQRFPEWQDLTQEERANALARVDGLAMETTQDLAGMRKLLNRDYEIISEPSDLKDSIRRRGQRFAARDASRNVPCDSPPGSAHLISSKT